MLTMQRLVSRPFLVLLSLPATAMGFALSVQIAVLSWILTTRYGLHIDEIGLVWAAGPLAGIIGQLVVGFVSDRVWCWGGRRRPFIVVGGVLSALMILALPSIGVISRTLGLQGVLGVAIVVALALDLSINVSFNPTRSLITDVTAEGTARIRGYTWMQSVSGTFGVLAYGVGALLGNDVLIYVGAVLVLLFSVVPALLIEEPRALAHEHAASGTASARGPGALRLATVLMPLWGFLAYDLIGVVLKLAGFTDKVRLLGMPLVVATAILVVMTLAARDRGAEFVKEDLVEFRKVLAAHSLSWIGAQTMFVYMIAFVQFRFPALGAVDAGRVLSTSFVVLSAVAAIMPALVLAPLTLRFGQIAVHAACLVIMAAAFAGIYLVGFTTTWLYTLMGFAGIGWAAIVSLPFAIMSQRVDQARIGLYMGVFNLSVVLPQLLVSLGIGTLISESADKATMFLICSGSVALSAVAWLFVRRVDGEATPTRASAPH